MGNSLKGFGSGAGMGGLVGAGVGAAAGAGRGYLQSRHEGAGGLSSALGGVSGAFSGAAKGALLGAGAGGLAGAVRPGLASAVAKGMPSLKGASNFGQRQIHGLTGVGDAEYVHSIGGGSAPAKERLTAALADPGTAVRETDPARYGKAVAELRDAQKAHGSSLESERRGLTSLPGYAKGLVKDPMGTLKAGIKDQWDNAGPKTRAAMYGIPAAGVVNEMAHKEDPSGEGRGRLERVGRAIGMGTMGALGPLPIAADALLSEGVSRGLSGGGRLLDRRGRRPPAVSSSAPEQGGSGTTQPSEYMLSDRAAGVTPESLS
jgi:hypothetical protein